MKRSVLGIVLLLGCSTNAATSDAGGGGDAGSDAAIARDVGSDASLPPDAGPDAADTGPAMVRFEMDRLTVSDGTPAAGASVCIVGAPPARCVSSSSIGAVSIPLEASTDHVLELSLAGHRTILYPVHVGTTDQTRAGDLSFFTVAEDEAYYATTTLDPATATLTLRAEGSSVLAANGQAGVAFEVVAPVGVALAYADDAAAMLVPGHASTTISGLAGASGLAPGTVDVRGHDVASSTPCHAWFGGFETGTTADPVMRIPVAAGSDTRLELRCR